MTYKCRSVGHYYILNFDKVYCVIQYILCDSTSLYIINMLLTELRVACVQEHFCLKTRFCHNIYYTYVYMLNGSAFLLTFMKSHMPSS